MTNRTRKIVLRVPVTPEERELIRQKMALLHTRNFSAFNCIGFSNVGFSCVGFSNVGFSNVGETDAGTGCGSSKIT